MFEIGDHDVSTSRDILLNIPVWLNPCLSRKGAPYHRGTMATPFRLAQKLAFELNPKFEVETDMQAILCILLKLGFAPSFRFMQQNVFGRDSVKWPYTAAFW